MNVKEYLLLRNNNISKISLNQGNSTYFLDEIVTKINSGFNLFIVSFSGLDDASAFSILKSARQLVAEYDCLFIVSGRIDLAYALKADGVYLDNTHLEFNNFKEFFSENFILISSSCSGILADIYID